MVWFLHCLLVMVRVTTVELNFSVIWLTAFRYAFPPLLHAVIQKDLHLTQNQIANSNIVALTAT